MCDAHISIIIPFNFDQFSIDLIRLQARIANTCGANNQHERTNILTCTVHHQAYALAHTHTITVSYSVARITNTYAQMNTSNIIYLISSQTSPFTACIDHSSSLKWDKNIIKSINSNNIITAYARLFCHIYSMRKCERERERDMLGLLPISYHERRVRWSDGTYIYIYIDGNLKICENGFAAGANRRNKIYIDQKPNRPSQ